jgi:hypothetical protein
MVKYYVILDFGIGALNLALQCNSWRFRSGEPLNKFLDPTVAGKDDKVEDEEDQAPYKQLQEEQEFDNFLEKMNDLRHINQNSTLNDDERRKNAENAILMFSKYLGLDDKDEDGLEDEDEDEA